MPRELINSGRDKRFVRRDEQGRFDDVVDVGTSLAADRRKKAKRTVKAGEGDRGDQKSRARPQAKKKTVSPAKQSVKKGARTKRNAGKGRSAART